MKNYFGIFFLFFISQTAFGQISLRVLNYRPTGDFGFVMKPLTTVELGYVRPFEGDRFRLEGSLRFLHLKPRLDTFPITVYTSQGIWGTTVFPGSRSYTKYDIWQLSGGIDYAFFQKGDINLFTGMSVILGTADIAYDHHSAIVNEDFEYRGGMAGLRFRIGAEYQLSDRFGVFLTVYREGFFWEHYRLILNAYDYGLGLHYSFNQ
jgi:hypothetical protein